MRGELSTYYLTAFIADTCTAAMSENEVEALSISIEILENTLALTSDDADQLYERAAAVVEDIPKPALCDPRGKAMRAFRQTLAGLTQ